MSCSTVTVIECIDRFNVQKCYMVLTQSLCVMHGLLPCTTLTDGFCITEVDSVYRAVHNESIKQAGFVFRELNRECYTFASAQ